MDVLPNATLPGLWKRPLSKGLERGLADPGREQDGHLFDRERLGHPVVFPRVLAQHGETWVEVATKDARQTIELCGLARPGKASEQVRAAGRGNQDRVEDLVEPR